MSIEAADKPEASSQGAPEIFGALDLGSNSFHLLLARFESGKLVVMDRHKENVRLAEGLDASGRLSAEAVERALASLRRFAERLRSTPVSHFRVVGTNTLRKAKGTDDFLEQAESILQSPINIISGSEEARLIYLGVANDLAPQQRRRLVVDIGGGSTELVVGGEAPQQLESLHLGCVQSSVAWFADGKLSAKAYRKALLAARAELQPVVRHFDRRNWDEAVGSSGTIRAVEAILENMGLNHEHTITPDGLAALASSLGKYKRAADLDWPGLSEERRAVLPGGLAVLHAVFLELHIERMHVSGYSIREGIILDLAGRLHNQDTRARTVRYFMEQYRVDPDQAQRVGAFAHRLLNEIRDDFGARAEQAGKLLDWAASLHEIGVSIAHSGYHKHGAYLLLNSDMPGFSKQEQKILSFLVLNHRRKLRAVPATYGFEPDWRLVQILRLACLFSRRRDEEALPQNLRLETRSGGLKLTLDKDWLADHPLTEEDLAAEQRYLKSMELRLDLKLR